MVNTNWVAIGMSLDIYIKYLIVEFVKFGETLTDNADGNPEPSSKLEKVQRLNGEHHEIDEEKVQTKNSKEAVKTVLVQHNILVTGSSPVGSTNN